MPKFNSSHLVHCPVTNFTIEKVVEASTGKSMEDFNNFVSVGWDREDTGAYNYWTHLILTDTSRALPPLQVFVRAHTSGATSTYEDYLVEIEVIDIPVSSNLALQIIAQQVAESIQV